MHLTKFIVVNPKRLVESKISSALESAIYMLSYFKYSRSYNPKFSIENLTINASEGQGSLQALLPAKWIEYNPLGNDTYNLIANIDMKFNYTVENNVAKISISKLGYGLSGTYTIVYRNYTPKTYYGSPSILDIDEDKLIEVIKHATPKNKPEINIYQVSDEIMKMLKGRYEIKQSNENDNIEKLYKVDFVTAKSRLQRLLNKFKYDDKSSTFVFVEETNSGLPGLRSLESTFKIALFPDQNDTIVRYSGEYQYVVDMFNKNTIIGKDKYNKMMTAYIDTVSKQLNKKK